MHAFVNMNMYIKIIATRFCLDQSRLSQIIGSSVSVIGGNRLKYYQPRIVTEDSTRLGLRRHAVLWDICWVVGINP